MTSPQSSAGLLHEPISQLSGDMVTEKNSNTSLILSFLAGATVSAVALLAWKSKQKEDRVNGTSGRVGSGREKVTHTSGV